jgi:putative peptidoglycan lipid II flippase
LLASTLGRLYSSTYYALRDTKTPLKYAIIRVLLTTGLGYAFAIPLPHVLGIEQRWGVAGLTISAGISSWVEFALLRRTLNHRIGSTGLAGDYLIKLWSAALLGGFAGWGIHHVLPHVSPIPLAIVVLIPYGAIYFGMAALFNLPEAHGLFGMISRRFSR